MIAIPQDKPVITGMNSYYLDIERLVDHYNGELESGVVHFHSNTSEGAIFFDDHMPLTGVHETKSERRAGKDAIGYLTEQASSQNYTVSVYRLEPDMVHYWAGLIAAVPLHSNLSTEFTELKALFSKMQAEKLTGYIHVAIAGDKASASVFFNFGTIIAGAYSWKDGGLHKSEKLIRELLDKADAEGAMLDVYQAEITAPTAPAASPPAADTASRDAAGTDADLSMVEDFLVIFETLVMSKKALRKDFQTALKQKFIEKADTYDFLDPFAAEFDYAGGSITFHGNASLETVAKGVADAVLELATEMHLRNDLMTALKPWIDQYADAISQFGLKLE